MIVKVTIVPAASMIPLTALSCRPTTFCPLISNNWWSVNSPFLAAEESLTMASIFPFLKWNPIWFAESLWRVIVLSNGLSLTASLIPLTGPLLIMEWTLSVEYPATFSPSICRIWSPNLKPTIEAGDPADTKTTNTPLLTEATFSPTLSLFPLQRVTSRIPWVTWAL